MAKYVENDPLEHEEKWGMPLRELYRLALTFYKQNSGKAIHLSYEDNLKLVAFTNQANNGPFNEKCAPELGIFDVIGKDRRLHWQQLGDISKAQAMEGFINLLDRMCSSFKPYIEAVKQDNETKLKLELQKKQEALKQLEKDKELQAKQQQEEEERYKEELQRRQLKDALNQQTYQQFKSYAVKQFPGSPEQQAVLICQLQKEHYHQYMQQLHLQSNSKTPNLLQNISVEEPADNLDSKESPPTAEQNYFEKGEDSDSEEYVTISPAKMWTRPDIKAFKKEVAAGRGDGVINVGHGDVVTVRVPTNANGKCIFWEFATDNYDIGFGVYFEWGKPLTNDVTVHVSESDDDDDFDDISTGDDIEFGSVSTEKSLNALNKPPITIIVPVYRRECFNEVYVGSHAYPGDGVYLLKFDNTFSVWRSKMLYYRVYYER